MLRGSILSALLIGCTNDNISEEKVVIEDSGTADTEEIDSNEIDDDGDGFTENEGDCDDSDSSLTPEDSDGDGYSTCEGDCDDSDSSLHPGDDDEDGQSSCEGDCDDQNTVVFNGAVELCDGQFNDCNGEDSQPTGIPALESDDDGDGYVECEDTQSTWVTSAPAGYGDCDDTDETVVPYDDDEDGFTLCENDCDDSDPFAYPGAAENESETSCMRDADGDGYGDINFDGSCCYSFILEDSYGDGWNGAYLEIEINGGVLPAITLVDGVASATDSVCVSDGDSITVSFISGLYDYEISLEILDPDGSSIYAETLPDEGEIYSGVSQCPSTAPTVPGTDCDDNDPEAYLGAPEIWYDGTDQDCIQFDDFDQDGDGYQADGYGGDDCDDLDPLVNVGMLEDQTDGIDNNCNGQIDERFSTQTIDTGLVLSGGQPLTIAVDEDDNVHVAYHTGVGLNYVSRIQGSWGVPEQIPVDSTYTSGAHVRGIVDGLNRFQLAFTSFSSSSGTRLDFMHMDVTTQSWSNQLVLDQITSGTLDSEFQLDIDVDTANFPTIGYFRQTNNLPYIVDISSFVTVPSTSLSGVFTALDENCALGVCVGYSGTYLSMAIDDSNRNHAVFFNDVQDTENQYNYTANGSSSPSCSDWNGATSSYIEMDNTGIYNDVAIQNISGDICVAYQNESSEELIYACNSTATCSGWTTEVVDQNQVGAFASLGFTSNDEAYIAYQDSGNEDIKLAHHNGITWSNTTIDSVGDVGHFIDLAIDSSGLIHVIYYDNTLGELRYATGQ